jgi:RNA polymerase sigma-70 factor (ECF subfamily)
MEPPPHRPDSTHTSRLLKCAASGDPSAVDELLDRHRPRLITFVKLHLDPRMAARIDPSDVVQEAQADLARRMKDYLSRRPMPFHLWARKTAYERLLDLHRRHLRRARRSVDCEEPMPVRSSLLLARPLLTSGPSPSREAEAREFADCVARAVSELAKVDREVLLMRHADGLPFGEIGSLLGIEAAAARKRFGRALIRLRTILIDAGLVEDQ